VPHGHLNSERKKNIMAGIPSRVNASAREQVLSTDLNRIGNLAGRELMDSKLLRSTRADFYDPSTNAFNDFSAAAKATQATPLSGLTQPPSLDGIAHVFDMNIGAGEGQLPATPASSDVSGYQLLRWDAQTLTWPGGGAPDATNPLICLIVATPADALSDLQSRNILLDPILRTVSPQNCYKTTNPLATLSVIAGAAAAAPVAPAVPAGALALFEVYVPPAVADSTSFLPVRRAWRQIEFPGTSQNGIVKGCEPYLQLGTPYLLCGATAVHRLVIDGELISFQANGSPAAAADTVNAPIAAVGSDRPLYLYLCGGRNRPALNSSFATPGWQPIPVHLVVSRTAPDPLGYPAADLGIVAPTLAFPRAACCYIGLCFYGVGGTTNVPAFIDGDWIFAVQEVGAPGGGGARGFFEPLQTGAIVTTPFALGSLPAVSDRCLLSAAGATGNGLIYDSVGSLLVTTPVLSPGTPPIRIGSTSITSLGSSVAGGATLRPIPIAYSMNIPRLAR
jgi:hypothetical protein